MISAQAEKSANTKPKLLTGLIAALVLFAFLVALIEKRAGAELESARTFAAAGDYAAADRHYFQSLNWYAPWGSSQKAADELLALGLEHLKSGREKEAFQSLLRLRSALVAARSFYQPREDLLEIATPLIALILARQKLGVETAREDIAEQAAIYQALYVSAAKREQRWYFVMVFSFLLWAGSAFYIVFAYFKEKCPLTQAYKRKALYIPLGVFAWGYLMWLFSMTMS
jgi:hypothetical protein